MDSCQKCGVEYDLRDGHEPTPFCDPCAQGIVSRLILLTPEPPKAITWEDGVRILDALQDELYSRPSPFSITDAKGEQVELLRLTVTNKPTMKAQ